MKSHKIGAGLVAIDAAGNVLTPFNTIGMYRGWITTGGRAHGRDAPGGASAREPAAMSEPILIWGAGAIGGTLGAYWARAGVPVLLVDIVGEHVRGLPHHRAADHRAGRGIQGRDPGGRAARGHRHVPAHRARREGAGDARPRSSSSSRISPPTASCSRRRTG